MNLPRRPSRERAALIGLALLVAGLIGYPLVELLRVAFERGWGAFSEALGRPGTGTAVANTVWTAAVATVRSASSIIERCLPSRWARDCPGDRSASPRSFFGESRGNRQLPGRLRRIR